MLEIHTENTQMVFGWNSPKLYYVIRDQPLVPVQEPKPMFREAVDPKSRSVLSR